MKEYKLYSNYFCGNKASDYAIKNGYLDYCTLAKAFNHVMCNDIMQHTEADGHYWECVNGTEYETDDDGEITEYSEIFQYFIIDGNGAEILQDYTDEIVYYCDDLDLYVWGVTHWGTSWDYVLTDIKLNCGEEAINE